VYGLATQPLTPHIAQQLGYQGEQGVLVAQVDSGSPADRAGLRRGDLIVQADRKPVRDVEAIRKALANGQALLYVKRGKEGAFFTVLKKDA
jgi:serine protease Do